MAEQDLVVAIGANIADLEKDLAKAKKELKGFETQTDKTSKGFTNSMSKMKGGAVAVGAAIAAATVALGAMTKATADNIREQSLWAKRLGVNVQNFSALVAVSRQFGAETDDVGDAMKDLNERIADAARGNKTYEDALKMVGLASKDLINLPVEEQFIKVADAIGKMNNVGDQNFATAELMADAGFRMLEVFRLGEGQIRSMTKAMQDNGRVITEDNVESSKQLTRAMTNLGMASETLGKQILDNVSGPLENLSIWILKVSDGIAELAGKDMRSASEKIGDMENAIRGTGEEWAALQQKLIQYGGTQEEIDALNNRYIQKLESMNNKLREMVGLKEQASNTTVTGESEGGDPETDALAKNVAASYAAAAELYSQQQLEMASLRAQADLQEINERQALMDQLNGIDAAAIEANKKLWEAGWKGKLKVSQQILGNLSTLMQSENRKMFEVGKAAATANAVIDTIASAQSSFNAMSGIPIVGPALGTAAAAAAVAAGMMRVQQIQSTTMGGGGGGGLGGAGAAAGGGATAAGPEVVNQSNFDITFAGEGAVPQGDVRGLIGAINEELANGAQLGTINVRG